METNTDLSRIKLLASDVDGVLTDGLIIYGSGNTEFKGFNIKDGLGIKMAWLMKLSVVWITGRISDAVARRADELNVQVYQGIGDKDAGLRAVAADRGLSLDEIAYVGDDLNDLPALRIAGYPIAVADSTAEVIQAAAYVTHAPGGHGAIREVIEHILDGQGRRKAAVETYLASLQHGGRGN